MMETQALINSGTFITPCMIYTFPLKNVKFNKNVHKINNVMTRGLLVSVKQNVIGESFFFSCFVILDCNPCATIRSEFENRLDRLVSYPSSGQ
jgi:hypothetical protein